MKTNIVCSCYLFSNENSKLRTYRLFKSDYCTDKYLCINFNGKYRSALAKFRAGVAPIRIFLIIYLI